MILSYLKLMNGGKKLHYHTLSQLMNEVGFKEQKLCLNVSIVKKFL